MTNQHVHYDPGVPGPGAPWRRSGSGIVLLGFLLQWPTILANKQAQKVALEPAGANTLRGQANLGDSHDGVKVVTLLTMPEQKPVQARFEMGHAGP